METITYREVEALAGRLSHKLQDLLGSQLHSAIFVPIPRGGWVVLGFLAYYLGLRPCTRVSEPEAHALAVVVDDCAITGRRFSQALQSLRAEQVVLATLVSPQPLREAIVADEARVVACTAARNVTVVTRPGLSRAEKASWRQRLPGSRYWIGQVEPFSFPWGEPDQVLWNARTQQIESDWRRASPRICIENRQALQVPWDGPAADGFDVPPHLVWKVAPNGDVILWHETRDRVFSLEGSGGAMWRALAATGNLERALVYLQTRFDAPADQIAGDLRRLAEQLVAQELLTPPLA